MYSDLANSCPGYFYLSLRKTQDLKSQHWTELLRIGIFAVQAGIFKKNLMGMDGEEEDFFFFFWTHHQLAVLSVPAGYTDS